jgi:hypothetical protein
MPPMAHFSGPSEDLTTMQKVIQEDLQICISKSTSMAQQHCNFTTDCHQFSAEVRVKENEDINNYGQP